MRNMENSANTPTSAGLEGQGRAVSMPKLNAEMQVSNVWVNAVRLVQMHVFCVFVTCQAPQ